MDKYLAIMMVVAASAVLAWLSQRGTHATLTAVGSAAATIVSLAMIGRVMYGLLQA